MLLCDALVEALIQLEVKYVFGVSGANIEHFHDAIFRLGEGKITGILAKSESGAAFMADGYARVHQKLGLCCATSGGGMLNLLAGVAESYADSVPVLAIVGQCPQNLEGEGAFQDSSGERDTVNAELMWAAASKKNIAIKSAADFWPALNCAISSALTAPKGPSVLLIPRNLFAVEVSEITKTWAADLLSGLVVPQASEDQLNFLLERITCAQAPVMICGSELLGAQTQILTEFAHNFSIPVATTMSARAVYPNNDSHFLGMIGSAGHPSVHEYINEKADLIIVLGSTMRVMTRSAIEDALMSKEVLFINENKAKLPKKFLKHEQISAQPIEVIKALNEKYDGKKNQFAI